MTISLIFVIGIIGLVLIIWLVSIYNGLINKKNQVENTFSSIDVYLKNRFDLIPNLVSVAKEAASRETSFIEKAISLRNQASNPDLSMEDKVHLDNEASQIFTRFFALSESYPQMTSIGLFKEIQSNLAEIEDRISAARRAFNSAVTQYNNGLEMFPSSIFAGIMGLQHKEWFEATEGEKQSINMQNLFNN